MRFLGLSLLIAMLSSLCVDTVADTKVRIRTTANGKTKYETIYVKGSRRRTDYSNGQRVARILYCDTKNAFMVDLDQGAYSEIWWPWLPSRAEFEKKAARERGKNVKGMSKDDVVKPQEQLTDTGERKEFYGRVARHMIAERKHPKWTGGPSQPHKEVVEDVTEAWYIHLPLSQNCEPPYLLDAVIAETDGGAQLRLSDFPVKLVSTTRYRIFGADGTTREVTTRFEREVVEFSEETLDPALFRVPQAFKKVRRVEIPQ